MTGIRAEEPEHIRFCKDELDLMASSEKIVQLYRKWEQLLSEKRY
ncbi:MAG: hypothetical protein ACYSTG_08815 [Planctomycetota bacterium]|jgi:hypothetical protein